MYLHTHGIVGFLKLLVHGGQRKASLREAQVLLGIFPGESNSPDFQLESGLVSESQAKTLRAELHKPWEGGPSWEHLAPMGKRLPLMQAHAGAR